MAGERKRIGLLVLCLLIGLSVAIAAASGIFLRGDMATAQVTTVRGERIEMVTEGIYRYNAEVIVAEGVGWDIVTLFGVLPAFLATLPGVLRGSLRSQLLAVGILAYFFYQYMEYATFWAYGPLYPLFVAIFALSLSAIALLVARIDVPSLPRRFSERFPRRPVIGLGIAVVLVLAGLWVPVIVRSMTGDIQDVLYGATTLVVPAYDLGLLVPLGVFTAVTVHRRMPVGYLLSSAVVVKAVAMSVAIIAMLIVEHRATGELSPAPVAVFAVMAALAGFIGWKVYSSIRPTVGSEGGAGE